MEARTECEAEVELTGKIEKSWSGEAFVITENRSGPVLYRSTQGKLTLTVFGAEGDFDALGSLSTGKESYTTQGGDFEVDTDGGGAEVDADARGNDSGKTVHITASFDC